MKRTHYCGSIRRGHMGQEATLCGWVQTRRDMGGVIFLDVKDREGTAQVVCDLSYLSGEDFHVAESLRMQSVVQVTGEIRLRDEETYNPKLATGEVELKATALTVLSQAKPLPFSLEEDAKVREELRLQYRYLDLRRPAMQRALRFRHQVQSAAERFWPRKASARWKRPCCANPRQKGRGIIWCPAAFIPARSTLCPKARRFSSSC